MIKAPSNFSSSNINQPGPYNSDRTVNGAAATPSTVRAQAATHAATSQAGPPTPVSNAGLAELKRLSQSLKPHAQSASGGPDPIFRNLEQPRDQLRRNVAAQFSTPARLATASHLPQRRPASLEGVRSLKQQSFLMLEQMAGPSARALLDSSLFQSRLSDR